MALALAGLQGLQQQYSVRNGDKGVEKSWREAEIWSKTDHITSWAHLLFTPGRVEQHCTQDKIMPAGPLHARETAFIHRKNQTKVVDRIWLP